MCRPRVETLPLKGRSTGRFSDQESLRMLLIESIYVLAALALVSAMVILSTMTTGWHYFVDVLGGILLAIISIVSETSHATNGPYP
jgi:membrane-associated phospholipid phosphatase